MSTQSRFSVRAVVYSILIVLCSWFGMQAVHELGHVLGALTSGAEIERVVLNPTQVSRTDVASNSNPGLVIWMGPIVGCLLPLLLCLFLSRAQPIATNSMWFFAGFCFIANGAYVGGGAIPEIGDCKVMLMNGSPKLLLIAFGGLAASFGLLIWHRLGDLKTFLREKDDNGVGSVSSRVNLGVAVGLIVWLVVVSFLR